MGTLWVYTAFSCRVFFSLPSTPNLSQEYWYRNLRLAWKPYWKPWACAQLCQACWTACSPVDCSLPGTSVYEILQARILEWAAISFSRRSSRPRDLNPCFLHVLHWQADSLLPCHPKSPQKCVAWLNSVKENLKTAVGAKASGRWGCGGLGCLTTPL